MLAELLGLHVDPHFSASGLNLVKHLPFAVTPLLFLIALAASAAAAAVSYYVVELPFLRRKEPERTGTPARSPGLAGTSSTTSPPSRTP
jgi:peptidoglycan/LPS O-acetylase OafA/YrhL